MVAVADHDHAALPEGTVERQASRRPVRDLDALADRRSATSPSKVSTDVTLPSTSSVMVLWAEA